MMTATGRTEWKQAKSNQGRWVAWYRQATPRGPVGLSAIPPPVPNVAVVERCWYSPHAAGERLGCASHRGPRWVHADKQNEDFAFSVQLTARAERWAVFGVADGVSNSTWSERGAQHAAAAFIQTVAQFAEQHEMLERCMREDRPGCGAAFCDAFCAELKRRYAQDERAIVEGRIVPPDWEERLYLERYFDHADAEKHREEWFESTLLAAALGPRGGFVLRLGDGFARIDRLFADGSSPQRKVIPLYSSQQGPDLRCSRSLSTASILDDGQGRSALLNALPEQPPPDESGQGVRRAIGMGLILATDGVSDSPDHGLEQVEFASAQQCQDLLSALAERPQGQVASDNMSIAFGFCEVS